MSAGFVSLDRGSQDVAARAGVALAVRRLERKGQVEAGSINTVAAVVGATAHDVLSGFWAFPASSGGRWTSYAKAVHQHGQRVSNRRWNGYSSAVRAAALEVADHVEELASRQLFPTND
ncbi:MAG: hypothetical protein GY832_20205 [Chloroflexi bacterium]|nr:hypothetical protein [Chloroflexota bacterium]